MARASSRWFLWFLPALGAVAAAILLGWGFCLALRGSAGVALGGPPPPPATPGRIVQASGRRLLLVLGDSLARGTGDASGRGFAGDVEEFLRRRGPVELVNLGVNGAESDDVRQAVDSPNVRTLAASADWILVSAGGNDLSHAVPRAAAPSPQTLQEIGDANRRFQANWRAILSVLREANASAPICLIGLYDPFGGENASARAGASVILSWNTAAQETALSFPRVFVVPTFDIFAGQPGRLAGDNFHPNQKGYDAIAQRVEQVLAPS